MNEDDCVLFHIALEEEDFMTWGESQLFCESMGGSHAQPKYFDDVATRFYEELLHKSNY